MILVDALILLFLIEGAVVFLIMAVVLGFKNRNYRRGLLAGSDVEHSGEYGQLMNEKKMLGEKVNQLEQALANKTKELEELQKKHSVLVDEYSVLYGKHFEGKEAEK
ncbi:MAG: hypothetical protein WC539_04915 [Nitrospirota bacterium]